mmetsp:Transcript_44776/g.57354  ORF Transcript_44776/g.57354 Transcript_44776/m.57354 type:complete len:204 (-) Transcript_44776:54-665(-)
MDLTQLKPWQKYVMFTMNIFFCLELYYSEWWEVSLSGDRCLYPESFHIFVSEICVGTLITESHQALCLPLSGAEELYRLPPTDDRTIFNYNILDVVLQLLFCVPFITIAIQTQSSSQQQQKVTHKPPNEISTSSFLCLLHFGSALLLGIAILAVTSAPTANSVLWAEGLLTCDVSLSVGPGPLIAFSGLIFEILIGGLYLGNG